MFTLFSVGVSIPAIFAYFEESNSKLKKLEIAIFLSFYIGWTIVSMFDFPLERAEHSIWIVIIMAILYIQKKDFYKPYFSFQVSAYWLILLSIISMFAFYICFNRFKGEYITHKIYNCRDLNNYNCIKDLSLKAESFTYKLDPVSMPISWYRGNANASLQNIDEAFFDFQKAYYEHPNNRFVLNDYATACLLKGNVVQAKILYTEASRISPRYDEPILNLIGIYIFENDYKSADYWFGKLKHTTIRSEEYRNLINDQLINKTDFEKSIKTKL